jgi:hypothetical protein
MKQGGSAMSILVSILTGKYAGRTATMPDDVNPAELLGGLAKVDIKWKIDYEEADYNEMIEWGKADMVARIIAALTHGRIVRFQDTEWESVSINESTKSVWEIEKAIVCAGMHVYVDVDDEKGVTITGYSPERKIQ